MEAGVSAIGAPLASYHLVLHGHMPWSSDVDVEEYLAVLGLEGV